MNRPIFFVDLDDTLFQTQYKCPDQETLIPAAYDREGIPHSFMTSTQQNLFQMLASCGTIIPVTARSSQSFARVSLPFVSYKVLDFGAVILDADGHPVGQWLDQTRRVADSWQVELQAMYASLSQLLEDERLDASVRIVEDFDIPLYLLVKQPPHAPLEQLQRIVNSGILPIESETDGQMWWIHCHQRQIACIPRSLGKENAVKFLIRELLPESSFTVGMGDSFADLHFMLSCNFSLIPRNTELAHSLQMLDNRIRPVVSVPVTEEDHESASGHCTG